MASHWNAGLLTILLTSSVRSNVVYVRSGSDIESCNMTCPHRNGVLELFRECRGVIEPLLDVHFNTMYTKNAMQSRLHLNTQSGCWRLTQAEKGDSCQYIIENNGGPAKRLTSTDIRIQDPVLFSKITSTCSLLGEDMALSVHFSGEESTVIWELAGELLPERYQLIDDNKTLIIHSVQREDTERRLRVRITNPISNNTVIYNFTNNPICWEMRLATKVSGPRSHWGILAAGVFISLLMVFI
ncbi:uncharacterized protein [Pyxicephalus adspersus]|uniref:uncharacterized protein n=1 Tax=Pyxicephalus adspersus TaxID=30357 RepID=UPI003B5BB032